MSTEPVPSIVLFVLRHLDYLIRDQGVVAESLKVSHLRNRTVITGHFTNGRNFRYVITWFSQTITDITGYGGRAAFNCFILRRRWL